MGIEKEGKKHSGEIAGGAAKAKRTEMEEKRRENFGKGRQAPFPADGFSRFALKKVDKQRKK